jgi:hypothetical protein
MIRKIPGEQWKQLQFAGWKQLRKKYAVSNLGRCASFTIDVTEDGKLLNGSLTTGYRTLNLHRADNKGTIYLHREVAKLFCKKASTRCKFVIHLNHNKTDNKATKRWLYISKKVRRKLRTKNYRKNAALHKKD